MGFFGSNKRVDHKEFKKALWKLHEHGFSHLQIEEVENIFRGDLDESGASAGLSPEELSKGIHWLKEHRENHHLSGEQIVKLEEVLGHYLL